MRVMLTRKPAYLALGIVVAACGQTVGHDVAATGTGEADGSAGNATAAGSEGTQGSVSMGVTSGAGGNGGSMSVGGAGVSTAPGSGGALSSGAMSGSGGTTTGSVSQAGQAGDGGSGGSPDVPGFDDLVIGSNTMGAYEGLSIYVAYDQNITIDSRSEDRSSVITNGAFEVSWSQGFDRDSFGSYAFVYVDINGDGVCSDGIDAVWWFFVTHRREDEGQPVIADFDPSPESATVGLEEIECAWFENGLSG